jgi:hypothetical protein
MDLVCYDGKDLTKTIDLPTPNGMEWVSSLKTYVNWTAKQRRFGRTSDSRQPKWNSKYSCSPPWCRLLNERVRDGRR